jgi:riboflavin-specific deaminase-like protein
VKRPFVTANFAITADGRISTRKRTPADFSSPRDKRRFLEIRAGCDAVLAGARTIASDNMTMGMPAADLRVKRRVEGRAKYPLRVLISNSGGISPALRIFEVNVSPILIFTTKKMPLRSRKAFPKNTTLHIHAGKSVDLHEMLRTHHADYKIRRLVCEGGAVLFRSLLAEGLIDELHLTVTPRVFGGSKAPTLTGLAGDYLARSTRLRMRECEVVEGECFLRYTVAR